MFCCTLLYVHSSFAIILMGKRELVSLLGLPSWCLLIVVWLFLTVPWVCLRFVIVVFPDHTHLLFFTLSICVFFTAQPPPPPQFMILAFHIYVTTNSRSHFSYYIDVSQWNRPQSITQTVFQCGEQDIEFYNTTDRPPPISTNGVFYFKLSGCREYRSL